MFWRWWLEWIFSFPWNKMKQGGAKTYGLKRKNSRLIRSSKSDIIIKFDFYGYFVLVFLSVTYCEDAPTDTRPHVLLWDWETRGECWPRRGTGFLGHGRNSKRTPWNRKNVNSCDKYPIKVEHLVARPLFCLNNAFFLSTCNRRFWTFSSDMR